VLLFIDVIVCDIIIMVIMIAVAVVMVVVICERDVIIVVINSFVMVFHYAHTVFKSSFLDES
jgi:hypothetical protein